MDQCLECGNRQVAILVIDGCAVHECQLCQALFGDAGAVARLEGRRAAAAAGVDERIWPVVQALGRLPGLRTVRSHAGEPDGASLPLVQLAVQGTDGLVQVENLAKSLLLAARTLHLHWVLEVEYQSRLVLVLKPRPGPGRDGRELIRDAWLDAEQLARTLTRDSRLSWWRQPGAS